ncbi:hypothetical protein GLOTRDRAFT_138370 [Gloeophyllum trabeum ATCC 11539]|uniref:Uncharacterized protein n=1 Tax=Gloeophyllum trabeum (strain ATCC 11539 / FP-39264 / Madison 617) TaxID=670483 RepID=S7QBH6_GLOTA|nr:uncharacterized protein GLOTRDRAFT_138370 [Gloeophyllum trabeum ATCC 11539]EPQ56713.1 hypothetical protein GLOTRDRAFT_138370 [Gloeophyllum trabeum ATCC 11539]
MSDIAGVGWQLIFAWDPLPCYPNNTLAIGILQGSQLGSLYTPDNGLVGPVLLNLGGRNESANYTYVFNDIGMVHGDFYQASLMVYNTTTGVPYVVSGIDFTWETPYPY